jgi:hypothetical protein
MVLNFPLILLIPVLKFHPEEFGFAPLGNLERLRGKLDRAPVSMPSGIL